MSSDAVTVSLVNDYEIIVHGLRRMLDPFSSRVRVIETEVGGLPEEQADVVLFDTFAGRRHSLERVEQIDRNGSDPRLALYTWDLPPEFANDIDRAGIDAVILKTQRGPDLVDAIERVAAGVPVGDRLLHGGDASAELTEREYEVLALIAQGRSNPEIARELYLSVETIKTHARSLYRKLGVANRTQAALEASRFGVAPPAISGNAG